MCCAQPGASSPGKRISTALPFDADGPQSGGLGRFNPIHLMFRHGGDVLAGTIVDYFYGGRDRHIRGTDDMTIMPLQSGTQRDSLSHVIFEDAMYNGYNASQVSSKGAAPTTSRRRVTGSPVARRLGGLRGWSEPGLGFGFGFASIPWVADASWLASRQTPGAWRSCPTRHPTAFSPAHRLLGEHGSVRR